MVCTILEGDTILMDSILDEIYDRSVLESW